MHSNSDRYKKVKVKVNKDVDDAPDPVEQRKKLMILIACVMGAMSCGGLYLNMASFFPIYVDGKFNYKQLDGTKLK